MAWVQGLLEVEVTEKGDIHARVAEMKVVEGPRPKNMAEAGANPVVFDAIRRRLPGFYTTHAWLGGATAIQVPTDSLHLLPENLTAKLQEKYGALGYWTLLCEVRNTGAPYIWNAAEPSGGMAESTNLAAEQAGEAVELGFYRSAGWVRFRLPADLPDLEACQSQLDYEQRFWWEIVRPGFLAAYEGQLSFISCGEDELDGRPGIITPGLAGDFQLLSIARLTLPGASWRVLDTECRPGNAEKGEPEWVPLRRKIVGIMRREGRSPMLYEFAPDGGLDECGLHLALSGEALELNISHLTRAALGPRGLGWLREEGQ